MKGGNLNAVGEYEQREIPLDIIIYAKVLDMTRLRVSILLHINGIM
jgi:hypothetical protein